MELEKLSKYWFGKVNIAINDDKFDDLFFGPITEFESQNEKWFKTNHNTWPQLLKDLGIFESIGEAKRNGWDKPIELGWNRVFFKRGIIIFLFKNS